MNNYQQDSEAGEGMVGEGMIMLLYMTQCIETMVCCLYDNAVT